MENRCLCKILCHKKKLIMQIQEIYPNLADSLRYLAPEIIVYKIQQLTGVDISSFVVECTSDCKACASHDIEKECLIKNEEEDILHLTDEDDVDENNEGCTECKKLRLRELEIEAMEYVDEVEKEVQKFSNIMKNYLM